MASSLLPPYPTPPIQEGICAEIAPHAQLLDEVRMGMAILGIIILIINGLGVLLFMALKNRYLRLQERSSYMIWFVVLGNFGLVYTTAGRDVWGRDYFPCQSLTWINTLVFLFVGGPVVANLYVYAFKLRRKRTMVRNANAFQGKLDQRTAKHIRRAGVEQSTFLAKARDFFSVWRLNQASEEFGSHSSLQIQNIGKVGVMGVTAESLESMRMSDIGTLEDSEVAKQSVVNTTTSGRSRVDWITKIFGQQFYIDCLHPTIFCIIVGIPFILVSIIRVATDPLYSNNCLGCDRSIIDYICIIVGTSMISVSIVVALYSTWNEPDPMGIKFEALLAVGITGNLSVISFALTLTDPNGLDKKGLFSWQSIQITTATGVLIVMTYAQVGIAIYQRRVIVGNMKVHFDLDAILENDKARNALLKHCTNELSSENVLFLYEVRMWVKDWEVENAGRIVDRAKAIYDSYISEWSEMTINVSYTVRNRIDETIAQMNHEQKPSQDLFEQAVFECERILLHDSVPRFQKTKIFELEIVNTGLIDKIVKAPLGRDSKKIFQGGRNKNAVGPTGNNNSSHIMIATTTTTLTDNDEPRSPTTAEEPQRTPRQSFEVL